MEIKPQSLNCNHPGHTYSKYTTIYLTPNDELLQQAISEGTSLSKKYHPSAPSGRIRNPIERNIKSIYGIGEKDVKKLMRENLKSNSYKTWRKRVREFSDRRYNYK